MFFCHLNNHDLVQMKTIRPPPTISNHTVSHTYRVSSLFLKPRHAPKTGTDYSPVCLFWLWLLLLPAWLSSGLLCAQYPVGQAPVHYTWRLLPNAAEALILCGSSPLQIGPPRPSPSSQPSKQPFPPAIITVNHTDSSDHRLSLQWSGHSVISAECVQCQRSVPSWVGRQQAQP